MATKSISKASEEVAIHRTRRSGRQKKAMSHGNWKLVYADFTTVLMAFFIVLWIMLFDLISQREKLDLTCLKPLAEALQKEIDNDATLKGNKIPLQVDYSTEGLRLTLLDNNEPMFQKGGTVLSEFAKSQFQKIASVVDICPTHKLKIEGYTDATPYAGGVTGYGNWELSTERANSARRELLAQSVAPDRISQVIGYGDSVPSIADDPTNPLNRRISITVIPPKTTTGELDLSLADPTAK